MKILVPVKRAVDVVEIFARVAKEIPARLLLVGDGPDRSQAEWLARRLHIQDRIHFLGKQAGVSDLLPLAVFRDDEVCRREALHRLSLLVVHAHGFDAQMRRAVKNRRRLRRLLQCGEHG